MTILVILFFVVMIATFGLWIFALSRFLGALNELKKQRIAEGAKESQGLTIELFRHGFTAPEFRHRRNKLVLLTLCLFAIILFGRFGLPMPQ